MSTLLLNRDGFAMPADGWYQVAPLGEFAHAGAGVVQVVDAEACAAMTARFMAEASMPNFAGLLVDFDHFSLDERARSEAAGWVIALEARGNQSAVGSLQLAGGSQGEVGSGPVANGGGGLWAKIRWSDVGEAAVRGGRYRFLSPVWARSDCVDLGPSTGSAGSPQAGSGQAMRRVRPVRLLNAAVTNDPNLKGMRPLCNNGRDISRSQAEDRSVPVDSRASIDGADDAHGKDGRTMKRVIEKLVGQLGLAEGATEDVILEKMQGVPTPAAVAELQNSLKVATEERDALRVQVKGVEQEIVNRHLSEFDGIVTEKTKGFWGEQLLANREKALVALGDLKQVAQSGKGEAEGARREEAGQTKKPLHNRATARPVIPGQGAAVGAEGDGKAVKIRNRAHEIAKSEKVPFSAAFRRAEREVCGGQ